MLVVPAQFIVVPTEPIASFMAFTTSCTLASLLPQTTSAAPLFAERSAAVSEIPFVSFASLNVGAPAAPPNLASSAKATAPVSEGLCT